MNLKQYLRGLGLGIIVSTLIVSAGKSGRAAELSDEEIKAKAKQLGMVESDEMLLSEAQSLSKETEDKDRAEKKRQEKEAMEPAASENEISENEVSENKTSVSGADAKKASPKDESMMEGSFLGAGAGSSDPRETAKTKQSQNGVSANGSFAARQDGPSERETGPAFEPGEQDTLTVAELESRNSDAGRASENEERAEEAVPARESEPKPAPAAATASASVTIVKGESSTAVAKKLQNAGVISDAAQFDSYLCLNGYDRKLVTGAHTIPAGATAREVAEIITGR